MNPTLLKVVGLDPSLRNWGWAIGVYDPVSGLLTMKYLGIAQTKHIKKLPKGMRRNQVDMDAATHLYQSVISSLVDADAVFVEVPVSSQSAAAMKSYGICVGLLGALHATGIRFYPVTATDVKMTAVGDPEASKKQMISWATASYPGLNWPTRKEKGVMVFNESIAEHMADACAAAKIGVTLANFLADLPSLINRKQHGN